MVTIICLIVYIVDSSYHMCYDRAAETRGYADIHRCRNRLNTRRTLTTKEVNVMPARSAITGKYVKPSTATRHPKTTVVEKPQPKKSGK